VTSIRKQVLLVAALTALGACGGPSEPGGDAAVSCVEGGTALPDGTACGDGLVCASGACTAACVASQPCDTGDACQLGVTACTASWSQPSCSPAGQKPDGTSCGTGKVCSAGSCVPGGGDAASGCTQPAAPGSWPVCNAVYGPNEGILELPVVAMTTDEAQNRWVATPWALYLLRPGDERFRRLDELDGLHLGMITGRSPGPIGWAKYCDRAPIADDTPCSGTVAWGGAALQGITSLAGGRANEVFVGYGGTHSATLPPRASDGANLCPGAGWAEINWCDPYAHSGKVDWVRLRPDGTLRVERFDLHSTGQNGDLWLGRLVHALAFDHSVNRGTLYAATEHGVAMIFPDRFRDPLPGEFFDTAAMEYMSDHVHAVVSAPDFTLRIGDWRALAIDAQGRMWHAGRWTAGRMPWSPNTGSWRWSDVDWTFGDPYPGPGSDNPPVFEVAAQAHEPRLTGVAVCPDGTLWFTSEGPEDGPARDRGDVLASWNGTTLRYFTGPQIGFADARARDVACLPDGRVAVAGFTSGLSILDPATGTFKAIRAASGLIPSDAIRRIEVDDRVSPPTLLVATEGGAAAIRVVP
jgi:hypothetical protein